MAQNKSKTKTSPVQQVPVKQEPSTAGVVKARRKSFQEERERINKERRSQGLPTDHELAVKARKERRAAERLEAAKSARASSGSSRTKAPQNDSSDSPQNSASETSSPQSTQSATESQLEQKSENAKGDDSQKSAAAKKTASEVADLASATEVDASNGSV